MTLKLSSQFIAEYSTINCSPTIFLLIAGSRADWATWLSSQAQTVQPSKWNWLWAYILGSGRLKSKINFHTAFFFCIFNFFLLTKKEESLWCKNYQADTATSELFVHGLYNSCGTNERTTTKLKVQYFIWCLMMFLCCFSPTF